MRISAAHVGRTAMARSEHLERLHRGGPFGITHMSSIFIFGDVTEKRDTPSHGASTHVPCLALSICLLVMLLNRVLVDVCVIRIHPVDVIERGREEGGILVAVTRVSISCLDGRSAIYYIRSRQVDSMSVEPGMNLP